MKEILCERHSRYPSRDTGCYEDIQFKKLEAKGPKLGCTPACRSGQSTYCRSFQSCIMRFVASSYEIVVKAK